jgi:hypothetical protein
MGYCQEEVWTTWTSGTVTNDCTADTADSWYYWHSQATTGGTADTRYVGGSPWAAWHGQTRTSASITVTDTAWAEWHKDANAEEAFRQNAAELIGAQDVIWESWSIDSNGTVTVQGRGVGQVAPAYGCNHKQRRRVKRRNATARRRKEKARRKDLHQAALAKLARAEAEERALELFEDVLGSEQRKVYEETGRLLVHGEKFDWIIHKKPHLVQRVEKGKVVDMCVHLREGNMSIPNADRVLAFGLKAKYDEDELNDIANVARTRGDEGLPLCAVM